MKRFAFAALLLGACVPEVVNEPIDPHPMTEHARSWFLEQMGEAGGWADEVPIVWVAGDCIEWREWPTGQVIAECYSGRTVFDSDRCATGVYLIWADTIGQSSLFHELLHVLYYDAKHARPEWQLLKPLEAEYDAMF